MGTSHPESRPWIIDKIIKNNIKSIIDIGAGSGTYSDALKQTRYRGAIDAVEVWEHQINSKTGVSKGTGNVDTEINITDVASSTTNYLFIQVANASGNEVHGGYITIAES